MPGASRRPARTLNWLFSSNGIPLAKAAATLLLSINVVLVVGDCARASVDHATSVRADINQVEVFMICFIRLVPSFVITITLRRHHLRWTRWDTLQELRARLARLPAVRGGVGPDCLAHFRIALRLTEFYIDCARNGKS